MTTDGEPKILHVDMDAFYAAIEERDQPHLRGQPVIVGGSPANRGVVSAANYVVRRYGVHSAMPTVTALKLCPQAIVLPPRISDYAAVSRQIRQVFDRYTPLVEPLALDEACLDVTGCEKLHGSAIEVARRIQREIKQETQLTASVGIAPNRFVAKIASDIDKPDGFVVVAADRVQEFLDPLPITRIWGVGAATARRFEQLRIATIGQFRQLSEDVVVQNWGDSGRHLWQLAHGCDQRPVVPDRDAKSISHETTFPIDVRDRLVLIAWLRDLTDQVARRIRRHKLRARSVHIKIRFADFQTRSRSRRLGEATQETQRLWQTVRQLFDEQADWQRRPVRLLGVGVSDFSTNTSRQMLLFDEVEHEQEKSLDSVSDQIHDKFGLDALCRGSSLLKGPEETGGSDE